MSATAFHRWYRAELALRRRDPLPAPALAPLLAYGIAALSVAGLIIVLIRLVTASDGDRDYDNGVATERTNSGLEAHLPRARRSRDAGAAAGHRRSRSSQLH